MAFTPYYDFTIVPDENGKIIIPGDSFGHGSGENYNDTMTKANYIATEAVCGNEYFSDGDKGSPGDDETNELPFENEDLAEQLIRVIKEHTGATEVILVPERSKAYIDHQSQGRAQRFFWNYQTDSDMKNFLFNSQSYFRSDEG